MDKAKNLYMDRFGFIEKNTLGKIYSTPSTVYVCLHFCGLTACGISVLPPEMNSHPLYWKCWVLTMTAVVQSLSCVQLFATPWTEVHQASLSFIISWNLMPSNHLILCHPLSPPSLNLAHQGLFQWVGSSHQVAKRLEFQLQYQLFQWIFRVDFL